MIEIRIPGFGELRLAHLVFDYNGTIAVDGALIPGVGEAVTALAPHIEIHVITADTFGFAAGQLAGLPVSLTVIPEESQAEAKSAFVSRLGADTVVAIGNGRNDRKMLQTAALGIALIQKEGASAETLASADVVSLDVLDALALLHDSRRLIATLRS